MEKIINKVKTLEDALQNAVSSKFEQDQFGRLTSIGSAQSVICEALEVFNSGRLVFSYDSGYAPNQKLLDLFIKKFNLKEDRTNYPSVLLERTEVEEKVFIIYTIGEDLSIEDKWDDIGRRSLQIIGSQSKDIFYKTYTPYSVEVPYKFSTSISDADKTVEKLEDVLRTQFSQQIRVKKSSR